MGLFSSRTFSDTLGGRVSAFRDAARESYARARRAADDAKREFEEAAQAAGLPTRPAPVIDVGERPTLPIRLLQAAAGALVLSLLAGGALTLLFFFTQILLAYLLSSQVLGLRFDLSPTRSA
jgi:hypothetical protein